MPLSPGDRLGPYEILSPLGKGGMGEVWRARDPRLNRDVAIKISAQQFTDRFEREARAIAALNHPNICTLFDIGPNYLVMELVEGSTLAERIKEGPVPPEEAVGYAKQIADALEAAHDKGIVHRDLKPANIKIKPDGSVKVLDFGLAKAGQMQGDLSDSPTMMPGTQIGMILGTAGYMSPEQARGKEVDKRADIWSFGVVLYEMLTGKTTFEGETVSDMLAAVLRADIDWKELPTGTPAHVRRILRRCLERDPKKRLRDIGDAGIELDAPELDTPVLPAAPMQARPGQNATWWLGWAAAVVMGAAGLGWALLYRPSIESRPVVRWTFSQKTFLGYPAFTTDGTKLLFTTLAGPKPSLWLRMMDQTDARPLPGAENLVFGEFSPDGQWLVAFSNDGKLQEIPITGGTPITLADANSPAGVTWGDDGTIVFAASKKLMRISSSGGEAETLIAPDSKKGERGYSSPHFLPGSGALLFTIVSGPANKVAALELKTRAYHVVSNDGLSGSYIPDTLNPRRGHLVYARASTLFAAPFDAQKLAVTGAEAPVVEGVSLDGPISQYAFSGNGMLVYVQDAGTTGGTTMGWVDPQGQQQSISETAYWGTGRLSPDGRLVANSIHTSNSTETPGDIWVFDTERKIKTRLTFGGINAVPVWTPDAKRISWSSTAGGKTGIYWAPADGSGKPEELLATESTPIPASWTPDGKFLLYSQSIDGKSRRIQVLPVSGGVAGKPYPLHDAHDYEGDPQVSPDGHWVAYVSHETGQQEVYIQAFPGPGAKERISLLSGDSPRWSRNGRQIYYRVINGEPALMQVDVQTSPQLHLGSPKVMIKGSFGTTFDTSPDPKRFLLEITAHTDLGDFRMVGIDNWFEELNRRVPVKR